MVGIRLTGTSDARVIGRDEDVPPVTSSEDDVRLPSIALLVALAAFAVPADILTSPTILTATCALILLGGLPHGALDLSLLRREFRHRMSLVIMLYLGLAVVVFATWQIAPSLALTLFLAMAMAHFAEDWSAAEHPFFALSIAVATVSAPALFHHSEMAGLFVMIAGDPTAAHLADTLLLIAPAAAGCAMLALLLLRQAGHRLTSLNAACALGAMVALPPVTGFAIYFCLIHSPMHFRAGLKRLAPAGGIMRPTIVATLGGLAIALALLKLLPTSDPSGNLLVASFMTLSVLTLPHMAVPWIVRRLKVSSQV